MIWKSDSEALPEIAHDVLLLAPRRAEFMQLQVARLLVAYEGACPRPVKPGDKWPTNYWWDTTAGVARSTILVTGQCWWAPISIVALPPAAKLVVIDGWEYIQHADPAAAAALEENCRRTRL